MNQLSLGLIVAVVLIIIGALLFYYNEPDGFNAQSGVKNTYNHYYPFLGGYNSPKGLYYYHYYTQPHYYKDFKYYPYYYHINYKPYQWYGQWWGHFYPRKQRYVKPYYPSWNWYKWYW